MEGKKIIVRIIFFFCVMALPIKNAFAAPSSFDIIDSLHKNYYTNTGIQTIIGAKDASSIYFAACGDDVDASKNFRIGSQTKMFTSTVILKMIDDNRYSFSLDDKLGDIANTPEVQGKLNDLLTLLPSEAANYTIAEYLNMGTKLPNFMAGTPPGSDKTIWDLWIDAKYGSVDGYSAGDPKAHERLVALSTQLFPGSAPAGFDYFYSNTNAVVLALMAEALSNKSFDELLTHYVTGQLGLDNDTGLQMEVGDVGNIGLESGKEVRNFDPTIPWTSGSGYASMESLLNYLQVMNKNNNAYLSAELFEARTNPAYQNAITMSGMPISYGLGLMSLDWPTMLNAFGLGSFAADVTSTGHGGSVAGASSFSGWLSSGSVPLDLGLVVYANSLSTIDNGGYFTATPSEALFVSTVEHLYRVAKADGTHETSGANTTFTHGSTGGYVSQDQHSGANYAFTSNSPSPIVGIDLTTNPELPLVLKYDPTYTYYSKGVTSGDERAFTIGSGYSVNLPAFVRIEGYGGIAENSNSSFIMLDIATGFSVTLDGEIAAYGKNAVALRTGQSLALTPFSHLYSKGVGGIALHVNNGAMVDVHSQTSGWLLPRSGILAEGSQSTGVRAESNAMVNIHSKATVTAVTYGYAMNSEFKTIDPWQHAVYGAEVSGAILLVTGGIISGMAYNPWNGKEVVDGEYVANSLFMPGIIAAGIKSTGGNVAISNNSHIYGTAYGILADGATNGTHNISITDSSVAGELYSLKGINTARVTVNTQNAFLTGGIQMDEVAPTSILSMRNSLLRAPTYDGTAIVSFGGAIDIDASNTFVLPTVFGPINVRNVETGNISTFTPALQSYTNAFSVSHSPDYATATLSGFTHGNANARRMFPAFAEYAEANMARFGEEGVANLALQADNLTPEPYAAQALISMSLHSALTDSAKGLAFPTSGRRQTYGMTSISDQAHAMSPDQAFGQGKAISAFHQDIREHIVYAQNSRLSEHGPVRKNDRYFLNAVAQASRATGQDQFAQAPQTGMLGQQQASLDQPYLDAFGSGRGLNLRVFGGYFHHDQDQNSRRGYYGYDAKSNGMIFGLGASLSSKLDVAIYGAWTTTDTDYASINADVDTDSAHFGLLGRYARPLAETLDLRLTLDLGYSHLDNDMERKVGGSRTKGSFDQEIYSVGVEAALDFYPASLKDFRVSPFVSATYSHLEQDGVTESGLAALKVHSEDMDQFSTVLGLGLAQDFHPTEKWQLTASMAASWRHDYGDMDHSVNANYAGYRTRFSAQSLERDRDAFLAGVGAHSLWQLNDNNMIGAKIGYGTELRDSSVHQQVFAGFEFRF